MQDGYTLDYVYQNDSLGGFPLVYAHPVDQPPYASAADILQIQNCQIFMSICKWKM